MGRHVFADDLIQLASEPTTSSAAHKSFSVTHVRPPAGGVCVLPTFGRLVTQASQIRECLDNETCTQYKRTQQIGSRQWQSATLSEVLAKTQAAECIHRTPCSVMHSAKHGIHPRRVSRSGLANMGWNVMQSRLPSSLLYV